jgi:hypothetical protein
MPALIVLVVAVHLPVTAHAAAVPWYDFEVLEGELGAELGRQRGPGCDALDLPRLPVTLPPDARLVLAACTGGPHRCGEPPETAAGSGRHSACPPAPAITELAVIHVVTRRSVASLRETYRRELGARFAQILDEDADEARFVQKVAATPERWSPKRLLVHVSPAKGPFAGAGYAAQVRLSFSIRTEYSPVSLIDCYLRAEALERIDPERADRERLRRDLTGQCLP